MHFMTMKYTVGMILALYRFKCSREKYRYDATRARKGSCEQDVEDWPSDLSRREDDPGHDFCTHRSKNARVLESRSDK